MTVNKLLTLLSSSITSYWTKDADDLHQPVWKSRYTAASCWVYDDVTCWVESKHLYPAPNHWSSHNGAGRCHRNRLLQQCQSWVGWLHGDRDRLSYKLAVLTFKIRHTSAPAYLSQHIRARSGTRLCVRRPFRFSMCPSDGLASANDHLAVLHLQLGTLCFLLSSTVTLSLYLNLG